MAKKEIFDVIDFACKDVSLATSGVHVEITLQEKLAQLPERAQEKLTEQYNGYVRQLKELGAKTKEIREIICLERETMSPLQDSILMTGVCAVFLSVVLIPFLPFIHNFTPILTLFSLAIGIHAVATPIFWHIAKKKMLSKLKNSECLQDEWKKIEASKKTSYRGLRIQLTETAKEIYSQQEELVKDEINYLKPGSVPEGVLVSIDEKMKEYENAKEETDVTYVQPSDHLVEQLVEYQERSELFQGPLEDPKNVQKVKRPFPKK